MDITWVKKQFPSLNNTMVFMDNAGGSQALGSVISSVSDFMLNYNVQLGASYKTSQQAEQKVQAGIKAMQEWVNAEHLQEVVISNSTTLALRLLSLCLAKKWNQGDEVIITNSDHEANRSPWLDLQSEGIVVKEWQIQPSNFELEIQDLLDLITPKTKLLALPHVSNILGNINNIKKITKVAHKHNVLVCVDGVAFAPHRRIDVQDLDVDFYVFSTYKTFGPHLAVLYGKKQWFDDLAGINHQFITSSPQKLQPGNVNYELTSSLAELPKHVKKIGSKANSETDSEKSLDAGFEAIALHEQQLLQRLLNFLSGYKNITIIGEPTANKDKRVATLSFVHQTLSSDEIVKKVDAFDIGIRFGDFYAVKLIDDLKLRKKQGVVRISLAHYNSLEEVSQLINALRTVF